MSTRSSRRRNNKDKRDDVNTHSTDSDTGQLLILTDDDDPNTLNSKKVNPTDRKRTRATRELTSFVWNYFKREEDLTSATCHVIKEDGMECGHYYNDGSTTSNLIHHLAIKHKIFKPGSTEEVIIIYLLNAISIFYYYYINY